MPAALVADRRTRGARALAWAAVAVLLASIAYALAAANATGSDTEVAGVTVEASAGRGTGNVTGAPPKTFGISGTVADLFPGVGTGLTVTLSNPNAQPIDVEQVDVAVGSGTAGCAGANVEVVPFRGSVRVPGRGTATLTLPIQMLPTAPDACQGASFRLTFAGRAIQVTGGNR